MLHTVVTAVLYRLAPRQMLDIVIVTTTLQGLTLGKCHARRSSLLLFRAWHQAKCHAQLSSLLLYKAWHQAKCHAQLSSLLLCRTWHLAPGQMPCSAIITALLKAWHLAKCHTRRSSLLLCRAWHLVKCHAQLSPLHIL